MLLCCADVDCAPGLPEMAMTSGVGENNNALCDSKCSIILFNLCPIY